LQSSVRGTYKAFDILPIIPPAYKLFIKMFRTILLLASLLLTALSSSSAFSATSMKFRRTAVWGTTTMEPPTETETRTRITYDDRDDGYDENDDKYDDLEYLQDLSESREMEDPFHILLMGSTFEKPKITVSYVSGSLEYVLDMPGDEALELSKFARSEGMSCLGKIVLR